MSDSSLENSITDFLTDNPDWSTRTRDWYKRRLSHFGSFLSRYQLTLPNVTPRIINIYLGELRQSNLSWSTRNGAYTILSNFFSWLRASQVTSHNPFADIDLRPKRPKKRRRVTKTIPTDYMRQMIMAAQQSETIYGCRDVAIMYLLATTGMRRFEVVTLKLSHISQSAIVVNGKGENQRLAHLRDDTRAALNDWLTARPKTKAQTVFISLHHNKKGLHEPLEPDAINGLLIKWRNEAKLPPVSVSPHKWRHTFATHLARAGNPFALQVLMGHADISTTKIYVHPSDDELREMVEQYGPKI